MNWILFACYDESGINTNWTKAWITVTSFRGAMIHCSLKEITTIFDTWGSDFICKTKQNQRECHQFTRSRTRSQSLKRNGQETQIWSMWWLLTLLLQKPVLLFLENWFFFSPLANSTEIELGDVLQQEAIEALELSPADQSADYPAATSWNGHPKWTWQLSSMSLSQWSSTSHFQQHRSGPSFGISTSCTGSRSPHRWWHAELILRIAFVPNWAHSMVECSL